MRVKDGALSTPLPASFGGPLEPFSEAMAVHQGRKFYLSQVQFDPTKKACTPSRIQVCRH